MPDSIMYQDENHFVVLEPECEEEFLTAIELQQKLETVLVSRQGELPQYLQRLPSVKEQAEYLRDNNCELELSPGKSLQWYAVRLEK